MYAARLRAIWPYFESGGKGTTILAQLFVFVLDNVKLQGRAKY